MLNAVDWTIAELAGPLATGRLTAQALLEQCLDRLAAHDGALHAMIALDPAARARAAVCDRARDEGRTLGPLHGVPVVVKDNIDLAGLPTTSGCLALRRAMPHRDAAQVRGLRAAGAVIVGKTNLSEFSFEIRSRSSISGDTRNPFRRDVAVTSGGSSGGTAVAVAAGFAVAGLGSDTGGSIRVPAAYNGLVGLRPTWGLLDIGGVAPLAPSTDTIGPIARSVDDAARLFAVMHGTAIEDRSPPTALRVGILRQAFGTSSAIAEAIEPAIRALTKAGVPICDPVTLPAHLLPSEGAHIVDAEFADAFNAYLADNFVPSSAPDSLAQILASGDFLPEHEPALRIRIAQRSDERAAILTRHRMLRAALSELMATHALDALLYPTSAVVPGSLDNPAGGWAPELAACSGWPAISVWGGSLVDTIPVGVELLGQAECEQHLFALAAAIEAEIGPRPLPALGWVNRGQPERC